jgi:hypothetical protein
MMAAVSGDILFGLIRLSLYHKPEGFSNDSIQTQEKKLREPKNRPRVSKYQDTGNPEGLRLCNKKTGSFLSTRPRCWQVLRY